MWQKICVLLLSSALVLSAAGSDTSQTGPRSPEEAEVLWREGNSAFDRQEWTSAILHFRRLIARYPGKSPFLKSHLRLGQSLLAQQDYPAATRSLRFFAEASGDAADRILGRNELSKAYLGQKKYHEAYLTAKEAEALYRKPAMGDLPRELLVNSLIARTRALMGLTGEQHEKEAITASEGALQVAQQMAANEWIAQAWVNAIALKHWQCEKFPSSKKLNEEQAKDQMDRRATCLLEALKTLKNIYQTQENGQIREGNRQTVAAWRNFFKAADAPPEPLPLKPRDRSASQKKRYFAELSSYLKLEARKRRQEATAILSAWSGSDIDINARDALTIELNKL